VQVLVIISQKGGSSKTFLPATWKLLPLRLLLAVQPARAFQTKRSHRSLRQLLKSTLVSALARTARGKNVFRARRFSFLAYYFLTV
jgi:hypothetical protein